MKSIWLVLILMILVAGGGSHSGVEAVGECGKFTLERMLTHVFRHCAKAARDVAAPVSANCCQELRNVPVACFYAIINSDAFEKLGINRRVAYTIPHRCLSTFGPH